MIALNRILLFTISLNIFANYKIERPLNIEMNTFINSFSFVTSENTKFEIKNNIDTINRLSKKVDKEFAINHLKPIFYKLILEFQIENNNKKNFTANQVNGLEHLVKNKSNLLSPLAKWITLALIKDYRSIPKIKVEDPALELKIKSRRETLKSWFSKIVSLKPSELNLFYDEFMVYLSNNLANHTKLITNHLPENQKPFLSFQESSVKKNKSDELDILDNIKAEKSPLKKEDSWKPNED